MTGRDKHARNGDGNTQKGAAAHAADPSLFFGPSPVITSPGPWSIRPFGPWPPSFDVIDAAGKIVFIGAVAPLEGDDPELRLANALLAAAAQELRAALRAALALNILDPAGPAWYRQAEAALKKSEGK